MSYLFTNTIEQSTIPHVMAYSACIGPYDNRECRLKRGKYSNSANLSYNFHASHFFVLYFFIILFYNLFWECLEKKWEKKIKHFVVLLFVYCNILSKYFDFNKK